MDIYQPAEDSELLQRFVREHAFGRVLDLGTGSGIQALTAAENKNVREIIAADINPAAITQLTKKIHEKKLKKIKAIQTDLFSNIDGKFDFIIFNPPYLPQDRGIEDHALYGGKKGWEISERFFLQVNQFLVPSGKIIFLFSTLTNKKKIEEIINQQLLEFQELGTQKLSFEELFVYLIEKSATLRELERQGIENINYLTHGKRGDVYTGFLNQNHTIKTHFATKKLLKVAIKVQRKESQALQRVENEAQWLRTVNSVNIGPKLFFSGIDYFVCEFIDGTRIEEWIKNKNSTEIKAVFAAALQQSFLLDRLKIDKMEMHHPYKHILINDHNRPIFIDFERCHKNNNPKNITQLVEYICRLGKERADLNLDQKELIQLAKNYKKNHLPEDFQRIVEYLLQ